MSILTTHEALCNKCDEIFKESNLTKEDFEQLLRAYGWTVGKNDRTVCPNCNPRTKDGYKWIK